MTCELQGLNTPLALPKTQLQSASLNPHSSGHLFDRITSWSNALVAYQNTQKGYPKHKPDSVMFSRDWSLNLKQLVHEVRTNTYFTSPYHQFYVYEPKKRLVIAPSYRDKIVQHMVNEVLRDLYEPKFICDSYSCIRGKGSLNAVQKLKSHLQDGRNKWGDSAYIVKADISKFFYSIDREIMKRVLTKHITDERALNLLFIIIDSSPSDNGLPLGNLSSQLMANIYMNEIDQVMKRTYQVRNYLRYADDVFMVARDKQTANHWLNSFRSEVGTRLNLKVDEKKGYVKPLRCGIDGLGFKVFHDRLMLKRQSIVKFKRMLKNADKNPSLKETARLNSWASFALQANCINLIRNHVKHTHNYEFKDNKFIWRTKP